MTIQHYTAAEYIVSQSDRIEQLAADVRELRKANVMLAAINILKQTTGGAPESHAVGDTSQLVKPSATEKFQQLCLLEAQQL